MDWSAVFDDGGEEEGDWEREEITSTRTGMLQHLKLEGNYGPVICYAFTVNYILGVGCLGIPYAFLKCGILLGSLLVIVLAVVSYMTVMWVALSFQQEELMNNYLSNSNPFILSPVLTKKKPPLPNNSTNNASTSEELVPLNPPTGLRANLYSSLTNLSSVLTESAEQKEAKQLARAEKGKLLIDKKRKERGRQRWSIEHHDPATIEVTDLAFEYLGSYGKLAYQASLMMLTYVGLLAYTQVFNSSFVSQVWPAASPCVPAVLFGLIVVPLSCFDLADQVTVQVLMSLLRFLSLGILLFGTIVAYFVYPPGRDHINTSTSDTPLFQLSGFSVMFTTAIFSQLFQHSVPGLISPLSAEHKKLVPTIFKCALATTSLIYISTGCICAMYFGSNLKQSVNLNFVGFTWGVGEHLGEHSAQDGLLLGGALSRIVVQCVAMTVVLFPALDTLSVFPLIANTLGNNLNSAFPGMSAFVKHTGYVTERSYIRRVTLIVWRLVAAVPPIIASMYVSDLILSLQIAGLCGIVVALVTPALLQRQCEFRSALIPVSMKANSPIPNEFSSKWYSAAVLTLAALALAIAFYQMLSAQQ